MGHQIKMLTQAETIQCVYQNGFNLVEGEDNGVWKRWLVASSNVWVGLTDKEEVACMWGIIPPTLLSDQCYLWLFTTEALKGYEFRFTRYSQRIIEDILARYPRIVGHVRVGQDHSMRWLRWLGASTGEAEGLFIPFTIRKKQDG